MSHGPLGVLGVLTVLAVPVVGASLAAAPALPLALGAAMPALPAAALLLKATGGVLDEAGAMEPAAAADTGLPLELAVALLLGFVAAVDGVVFCGGAACVAFGALDVAPVAALVCA
jgi:hypothetical protein